MTWAKVGKLRIRIPRFRKSKKDALLFPTPFYVSESETDDTEVCPDLDRIMEDVRTGKMKFRPYSPTHREKEKRHR